MKKTASVVLAAAIAVTGLSALSAGVSAEWVKSGTTYSYRDESGNKLKGWQEIDGNKYYFDKEGKALTGRKKINGDSYYFIIGEKGRMATLWQDINGRRYYFGNDGVMRKGWVKLDGSIYYFGTDGAMRTGKIRINGEICDFGTDGRFVSGGMDWKWGLSPEELTDSFDAQGINYFWDDGVLYTDIDGNKHGYSFNSKDKLSSECVYAEGDTSKDMRSTLVRQGYRLDYKEMSEDGIAAYAYTRKDSTVILGYLPEEDVTMEIYLSPEASRQLAELGYDRMDEVDI